MLSVSGISVSSSIRPCLYMSPLLCWSRVSLPQLHGALQPKERHLESTVRMSIRMSILSLSLICYFLSVYSELRQCMLTLDRSSSFILSVYSELTVLCRTLSVLDLCRYILSCVVLNFNFCLTSLALTLNYNLLFLTPINKVREML